MNFEAFTTKAPGVYVVEEPSASQPITGASISNCGFVGIAEDTFYSAADPYGRGGQQREQNKPGQAVQITSWGQYVSHFGSFLKGRYLAYAVYNYFQQGGSVCYVSRAVPDGASADTNWNAEEIAAKTAKVDDVITGFTIRATSAGAWGDHIYVEVDGFPDPANKKSKSVTLNVYYCEDPNGLPSGAAKLQYLEDTYYGLPAVFKVGDATDAGYKKLQNIVRNINGASIYIRIDAKAGASGDGKIEVSDSPKQLQGGDNVAYDFIGMSNAPHGLYAFEKEKDARVMAIPDLGSHDLHKAEGGDPNLAIEETLSKVHAFIQSQLDRFYIIDPPAGLLVDDDPTIVDFRGTLEASSYWSLYYPWLEIANPLGDGLVSVPPSGSVAGVIANSDVMVGPWQSPAGITYGGVNAFDLAMHVTEEQHGPLNEWPTNINVIRKFPDIGSVIWGARTLSSDKETKYVAVRRLLLFIELSIKQSLQWAVFLPNNPALWELLKRDIDVFLTRLWHQGALFGDAKNQAFQIICDHTNNTTETIDEGLLIVQVAVAPVRPAEFVVVTVSQNMQTGGG